MTGVGISERDLAHWCEWIGREQVEAGRIDGRALRQFAAAIGEPSEPGAPWPSLGHWAVFAPVVGAEAIGEDGHPRRGGFLPSIGLPRRMFAAADMTFGAPLATDATAERISTIVDVAHKSGRSGDLVLVTARHVLRQNGRDCMTETQTIVYRAPNSTVPAPKNSPFPGADGDVSWSPGPVDLFRFSAATGNAHRIHYDLPYATGTEGYPALVVHGPFTAARLFQLASRRRKPRRFAFRAIAPLFCGERVVLRCDSEATFRAIRCDGADAMTATVEF